MTQKAAKDCRKISGPRVMANCEAQLPDIDPFSHSSNVKTGSLVFNVRGGCLYMDQFVCEENLNKIFPNGQTTVIKRLSLLAENMAPITLYDVKVNFLRLKRDAGRTGVVFRFQHFTEEQLDTLLLAQNYLPEVATEDELLLNEMAMIPTIAVSSPPKLALRLL